MMRSGKDSGFEFEYLQIPNNMGLEECASQYRSRDSLDVSVIDSTARLMFSEHYLAFL